MQISRIGLDLAKNVSQVHGVDRHDGAVLRKKLDTCTVAMEAIGGRITGHAN